MFCRGGGGGGIAPRLRGGVCASMVTGTMPAALVVDLSAIMAAVKSFERCATSECFRICWRGALREETLGEGAFKVGDCPPQQAVALEKTKP